MTKQNKRTVPVLTAAIFFLVLFPAGNSAQQDHKGSHGNLKPVQDKKGEISHYTCGMHPGVKVSPENYEKGDTKCPICFMPLTPVRKGVLQKDEGFDENVISKVEIRLNELKLAGVKTEPVVKRELFKEIRRHRCLRPPVSDRPG
jgi:hypothetical protein